MVIKYACFDIGNVANVHDPSAANTLLKKRWPHLSVEEVIAITRRETDSENSVWRKFQNGQINSTTYLSLSLTALGIHDSEDNRTYLIDCLKSWCGIPYMPMVDLAVKLKKLGIHTCVLSNNNEIMYNHSSAKIKEVVDVALSSHEIGVSKPEPEAYQILLERIQAPIPSQVLFIDDLEHNINAAATQGINTFHFNVKEKPRERLLAELISILRIKGINC